jgi:hypothetical protein
MNHSIWRLCGCAVLGTALGVPTVQAAETITFDDPALGNIYGGFQTFSLGDYSAWFQSDGGLIGTAADLPEETAPLGNDTPFLTALNSGVFSLWRADGQTFSLQGFDFAYVPHPYSTPPLHDMALIIHGAQATGVWLVDPTVEAHTFQRFDDPAQFAPYTNVRELHFTICSYNPLTQDLCSYTLGTAGQFALDNVVVQSPVPEPRTLLMWALGLAALTTVRRARNSA